MPIPGRHGRYWSPEAVITIACLLLSLCAYETRAALLPDTTLPAVETTTLPYDDSSVLMWAIPVGVLTGVPILVGVIVCSAACISCLVSVKQNKERNKVTPSPGEVADFGDFDPENFDVDDFDLDAILNEGMGDLDMLAENNENDVVVEDEFDDDDPFKDDKKPAVEDDDDIFGDTEDKKDKKPIFGREKTVKFAV